MTRQIFTAVAALALVAVCTSGVWAAVRVVDDDNVDCFDAPYRTIHAALVAALPGDEILVCPGIYPEQVVLEQQVFLVGLQSGSRRAVVRPVTLPVTRPSVLGDNPVTAAVLVDADKVQIDNIDVDLTANTVAGCTPVLTGVYFRNVGGSLRRSRITGARVNGHPECESGVGLYIESGPIGLFGLPIFGSAVVALEDDLFADYQKAGMAANGTKTVIRAIGLRAQGDGPRVGPPQIGFQLGYGGSGRIQDSSAEALKTLLAGKTAPGILLYGTTRGSLRRNTTTDTQTGVFVFGSRNRVKRGQMLASSSDALVLLGDRNRVANNTIGESSVSGVFIDGEDNRVRGGDIASTPIGVWLYSGSSNRAQGVSFHAVPQPILTGGTRILDQTAADPFATTCANDVGCDDGNPCTTDACDLTTGKCNHVAVADGTSCTDANVCNGAETCVAGVCVAGTALVCSDGNECTTDTCDAVAGCQFPPVADGTPCATGTCTGGVCL